ncbi:MAG: DUF4340 domain-containing protein [Lachnospiraceae bacterium]|nr:DUF4340 domain-containing protein [Lachnospiraceae bacterium]
MRRQRNQLMLMAAVLFLTAAGYIGMKNYNAGHREESETESYPVVELDAASVTRISLDNENGSYSFQKEGEEWICGEDELPEADASLVEDLVKKAVSIHSEDRIEEVGDLSQYGLAEPVISVSIQTEQADLQFNIGDYNSAVSKYYICVEGENTVYTIDSTLRSSFAKDLDDFRK